MSRKRSLAGLYTAIGICLLLVVLTQFRGPRVERVSPIEANRVVISYECGDGMQRTEAIAADEGAGSEIVSMCNSLRIIEMSRPMAPDRINLTFYQNEEFVTDWHICIWEDDRMIITSSEAFGLGNHAVVSEFDYDRLIEIYNKNRSN